MSRITWLLGEIADRTFPLLALCGLMLSLGLLGSAADLQHRICATILATRQKGKDLLDIFPK